MVFLRRMVLRMRKGREDDQCFHNTPLCSSLILIVYTYGRHHSMSPVFILPFPFSNKGPPSYSYIVQPPGKVYPAR